MNSEQLKLLVGCHNDGFKRGTIMYQSFIKHVFYNGGQSQRRALLIQQYHMILTS